MPFDYQLVGGTLIFIIGLVGVTNAMVERRSPLYGLIGLLVGAGLLGWAWMLSDGSLTPQHLPQAVFRLIAEWI
ncbi:hypothetical protein [Amylibacter sp. IMCC11727]|uniref:hypothetical protein n=1 Tax=Amylibacter sp. IMCC11727 TaxID=3039851 RepID=UPI00244DF9ED|nr:hypothetical protein [Amylibacter sp. IMCC11727]WGI21672.1 hypothetical protein QBD29_16410 [Amylibacter sp. IMCC11727]